MSEGDTSKSVATDYPIASILRGLSVVEDKWNVFVPNCEPFRGFNRFYSDAICVPTPGRGVFLAGDMQGASIVLVPNRQLPATLAGLKKYHSFDRERPLVFLVEDHPFVAPQIHPRELLREVGITALEPCNAKEAEFIGIAAGKLAAATNDPIGIIAHHGLLGGFTSSSSEEVTGEVPSTRPHSDTSDPTRLARRLELNRQRTLPSPGERGSVGFITVGLADSSLRFLISELRLLGRVPSLNLRLVSPIDDVPIKRLLTRCHNLVVLEPRPGEIESEILTIAQRMRREGEEVALVWGRELPSIDPEHSPVRVPVDSIHPSVVARMIKHLLHEVRPASDVEHHLIVSRPSLPMRPSRRSGLGTEAALRVLKETAKRVARSDCDYSCLIDGEEVQAGEGKTVSIETWGSARFHKDGVAVVRSLAGELHPRIFLVWEGGGGLSPSPIDISFLPVPNDDKSRVLTVPIDNIEELEAAIGQAILRDGASIIVVREGNEPRFDVDLLDEACRAIDARGFLEKNTISITMTEMSAVRFKPKVHERTTKTIMPLETRIWSDWLPKDNYRFHASLRPVLEQATVVRVKPPIRVVSHTDERLTPPKPVHADALEWRAHIAGTRGDQLGVVGEILLGAASIMGYETRCQSNSAVVGAGRHAWTQILFTRPQTARTHRPLVAFSPWGEADLLLGWDREETMRAFDPEGILQIGSSERTFAIVNTGQLDQQVGLSRKPSGDSGFNLNEILSSCRSDNGMTGDFSAWARYRFHNTRLGDLVQLGVAFQQGLIPVTVDAINVSLREAEVRGFARSKEAFDYGRRIALHPDATWMPVDEDEIVDLTRLTRRYIRNIRRVGYRGKKRSEIAKRLFNRLLQELPGLSETIDGREALFSAVVGIRRCILWGGEKTATAYVELIEGVYKMDSVESGRELTRYSILVLAEVMLVRDPIYLARLVRSPEIIRSLRNRLNVRKPRGDELHRRFLSRFELCIGKWRLRADIRTSDWSSALISNIGRVVPSKLRGRKRDREVREIVIHSVNLAMKDKTLHGQWLERFEKLNKMAVEGSLHRASTNEIRLVLDGIDN